MTDVKLLSAVWPCFVIVEWNAVITRSNIVKYYINNYRNWGRISIRCWTQKKTAIPRPHGRAMGVFCEYLWENVPHYNDTALYVVITRSDISTRRVDITEPLWVWAIPLPACVITWLCTDSPLPDCYIVLLITSKHPTHSNTGTVTVAELSCTHSFPHNDPMHGFGDECVQYYSQPQSYTHV